MNDKNKNILIVFDNQVNVNTLVGMCKQKQREVELFSLTSDWKFVNDLKNLLSVEKDLKVRFLNSTDMIYKEVVDIRAKICQWSANCANCEVLGRSLREWFLLPGEKVSTWWFSLIAEKNTLNTEVFLELAQLQAIDKVISREHPEQCFLAMKKGKLSRAIKKICQRHEAVFVQSLSRSSHEPWKERIRLYLDEGQSYKFFLKSVVWLSFRIWRVVLAKGVVGSLGRRLKQVDQAVLFVSYFPAVDQDLAQQGILKNRYAGVLQDQLKDLKKKIIWIWMYVSMNGHNYTNAIYLARKFTQKGELNFFLEEFMSMKLIGRVIYLWFRQIWIFLRLRPLIPKGIFYKSFTVPEGGDFIQPLLAKSFVGRVGLEGIFYFELFKKVFTYFPSASPCIYYAEMHVWEKALNAAKEAVASQVKSIGFQHSSFPRNYFHYFSSPDEIKSQTEGSLPLPDVFACNGRIPYDFIKDCGYPNLTILEAVRNLYLNEYLNKTNAPRKENIILIAGSVNKKETKALMVLFQEAFPHQEGFRIWLKGHPSLPLLPLFKELDLSASKNNDYLIKEEPIQELLKSASVVCAGASTVGLEALAVGCHVIVPVFPDSICLSPLEGFKEFYHQVRDPGELRQLITNIFSQRIKRPDMEKVRSFISRYWCLDSSLQRWEKCLLNV